MTFSNLNDIDMERLKLYVKLAEDVADRFQDHFSNIKDIKVYVTSKSNLDTLFDKFKNYHIEGGLLIDDYSFIVVRVNDDKMVNLVFVFVGNFTIFDTKYIEENFKICYIEDIL